MNMEYQTGKNNKSVAQIHDILKDILFQKVTIFKMGEMGFPQCFKCKIVKLVVEDYAQHKNSLTVYIKVKGKRKVTGFRLYNTYSTNLLIWENWIDVKSEMFIDSIGYSFSYRYIDIALNSTKQEPFIKNTYHTIPQEREEFNNTGHVNYKI